MNTDMNGQATKSKRWMKAKLHTQIYRFAVVGVINTAIDLAVLNLLIFTTHRGTTGAYSAIYKGISFIIAVANSYVLNRKWTFAGAKKKKPAHEAAQYFIVSFVGLIVNDFIATAFVHIVPPMFGLINLWPTVGGLAGTAGGLIWNFLGYRFIVFKHEEPELLPPA